MFWQSFFYLWKGATQCAFYMQYGTCKYGSTCKFDHPITNNLTYSSSTSSLTELTLTPYPVGMSVATFLPALNNGAKMMYPKVVSNRNTDKQQQVYDDDSFGDDMAAMELGQELQVQTGHPVQTLWI